MLVERFRRDLTALWTPGPDDRLLVAVSGGPDSMALLLLAHAALGDGCVAATVDHGLRRESAAEASIVADTCRSLGIAHATLAGAMPARAGRTANLSARARAMRYRLLERHMADVGAARLATAHHADDQLETLIMRLNRGAGVSGLAGVRGSGDKVVRPLLGWRRAELVALVGSCGGETVADPSNVDERFDRARLRKALADADWLDPVMWGRSAAALDDAETALDWAARRFVEEHGSLRDDGVYVLLVGAVSPPWEIARRAFHLALRRIDPAIDVTGSELSRLTAAMLGCSPTSRGTKREGAVTTLGRVRVAAERDGAGRLTCSFRPTPPPRAH